MNTGILIIAHAPLASAFRSVVGHVFAEHLPQVLSLDIPADADVPTYLEKAKQMVDQLQERALSKVESTPAGQAPPSVLVFTDAMGATPCNVAALLGREKHIRVVTGLNLPMIWRTVSYIGHPIEDLVQRAVTGGVQCIQEVDMHLDNPCHS
jgi:PTS system ascorbate-specific IIA component